MICYNGRVNLVNLNVMNFYSKKEQIEKLYQGIMALKSRGRPYDYLQERLNDLITHPSTPVDIFKLKEIKHPFINEKECEEIQTFGYVISGNPYAKNCKLESHPVWKRFHR